MRALFLGDAGAVPARVLWAWLDQGHEVAAFWRGAADLPRRWQQDAALGRIKPPWSVQAALRRCGRPLRSVPRLAGWPGLDDALADLGADVLLCAHFMHVVPRSMLEVFDGRAVNYHPALLPAYRGPDPRGAMLLDETANQFGGVTLHVMTEELDIGAIVGQRHVPFSDYRTVSGWGLGLARAAEAMTRTELPAFLAGRLAPRPQPTEGASYERPAADAFRLSPDMSAERIRWLCDTVGRFRPVAVAGADGAPVAVDGFVAARGAPTGCAPRLSKTRMSFDARDARVTVRRRTRWTDAQRRIGILALLLREHP